MIDAVARGRFPPWPRVENRRSAIHVDDAVRAALLLASDPRAAGQVYLATDGRAYSTRWLYEQIRLALGRPAPAWVVPLWLLKTAASAGSLAERLTGRAMPLTRVGLSKLTGDAWYSSEKIRRDLGFEPEHSLEREIPDLVRAYLESGAPR
jgi:nucleoside-diphosphate-sugar epimerase